MPSDAATGASSAAKQQFEADCALALQLGHLIEPAVEHPPDRLLARSRKEDLRPEMKPLRRHHRRQGVEIGIDVGGEELHTGILCAPPHAALLLPPALDLEAFDSIEMPHITGDGREAIDESSCSDQDVLELDDLPLCFEEGDQIASFLRLSRCQGKNTNPRQHLLRNPLPQGLTLRMPCSTVTELHHTDRRSRERLGRSAPHPCEDSFGRSLADELRQDVGIQEEAAQRASLSRRTRGRCL
jgi:hypothetical protein